MARTLLEQGNMTPQGPIRFMLASMVIAGATLAGCGGSTPSPEPAAAPEPAPTAAEPMAAAPAEDPEGSASTETADAPKCELVCGDPSVVVDKAGPEDSADEITKQAEAQADKVLDDMHDDLLACYAARAAQSREAHAFMKVSIVVGPDGKVRKVETEGGALLGEQALACLTDRIRQGEFTKPPHGGTMRIEVPLTFRQLAPGEAI